MGDARSRDLVKFVIKPAGESDQVPPDGVRLVSQAWLESSPGPLIGFAPANRIGAGGLPWASRRVTVVWGWHFPTCILPCRGRKPVGMEALHHRRLGDDPVVLTEMSRKRLDVRAGPTSLAVVRCGRLAVGAENEGVLVFREGTTRSVIDSAASPEVISLTVALWASDQMRGVWSIGRHLLNGI